MHQSTSFKTTCWALLGRVASGEEKEQALEEVIRVYWYPLYSFCRRQGYSDHDAMDCTQGFLTHLIENKSIDKVESGRGRFRNFLLVAFKNYLKKQYRYAQAQRRGGTGTHGNSISIGTLQFSMRYCEEVWDPSESPDRIYERQCVGALLESVTQKVAESYSRSGKQSLFEVLSPLILSPEEALNRSELAENLSMSMAAVNMALHRMRMKYAQVLRFEVSRHMDADFSIEEEIKELLKIVTR